MFDVDSLPLHLNRQHRQRRAVDELIGLCRGMLADGEVNASEAKFLADWLSRNQGGLDDPLAAALYRRVDDALSDGVLDPSEEADLLAALHSYIGGEAQHPVVSSQSTWLPLDDPAPPITFAQQVFVVTGTFVFGARRLVRQAIEERGGIVAEDIRAGTNVLVIGETASRDWAHSSYGRKIMKAVEYREKGHPVTIVAEAHWRNFLDKRSGMT